MARILVIDDDARVLALIKAALERHGHAVQTAANGNAGIRLLMTAGFDLVITEIIMPGRPGLETIRMLRSVTATLPLLLVSGGGRTGHVDVLDAGRSLGATDSLAKPFHIRDLIAKVTALLEDGAASDAAAAPLTSPALGTASA